MTYFLFKGVRYTDLRSVWDAAIKQQEAKT